MIGRRGCSCRCYLLGLTTAESKLNPMELMIFLTEGGGALGDVYFDDGDSIVTLFNSFSYVTFEAGAGYLLNVPEYDYYQNIAFNIEKVSVAGVNYYVSGRKIHSLF